MSNGKAMIINLIAGLIKKTLYKNTFLNHIDFFEGNVKFQLDLSSYATKAELKNATGVDTSKLAAKSDLANLKTEVDKIDLKKLKLVPVDLSKLSNIVNNDVIKQNCV